MCGRCTQLLPKIAQTNKLTWIVEPSAEVRTRLRVCSRSIKLWMTYTTCDVLQESQEMWQLTRMETAMPIIHCSTWILRQEILKWATDNLINLFQAASKLRYVCVCILCRDNHNFLLQLSSLSTRRFLSVLFAALAIVCDYIAIGNY